MADFRKGVATPIPDQLKMLTVEEVADALRVQKQAVYALINRGELRFIRVGNRIRIPYFAYEALLSSTTSTGDQQSPPLKALSQVAG